MLGPDGGVAGCGESVLGGGGVGGIGGMGFQRLRALLVGPFSRKVGCAGLQCVVEAAGFGLQIDEHLKFVDIGLVIWLGRKQCRDGGVEIHEPGDDLIAFEVVVRFTELGTVEHPFRQREPSKHEQLDQPSSCVPDD